MANALINLFEEVGVSKRELETAIATNWEVRAGIMEKTAEVEAYWKKIAAVNKHGDITAGRPHMLKGGYIDEPGDYRDSIRKKFKNYPGGFMVGIVYTRDYKAHWLEYGSIHNPEYGYAQKTIDALGGKIFTADKEDRGYVISA